jgi:hypothetical protein
MKFKSLFLGICFGLSMLSAGIPAQARTQSAFSSFHVRLPIDQTQDPYNCVTESWGAVINSCAYDVTLTFDLPVDYKIVHTLEVQNYVNGTGTTGARCTLWSYDGKGGGQAGTTNLTFNPNGEQTLTFTSALFGNSIALDCEVPRGAGLGAISWNP